MSIHIDVVNIYVSSPEILAEIRSLVRNTPIKVHTLDQIEKEESKFTEANIEKRFDKIIDEQKEAYEAVEREIGAERFYNTIENPVIRKVGRPRKYPIKEKLEPDELKARKRELSYQNFTERTCKQCQKGFMPKTVKQLFCSNECYRLSIKEIYK